MKYVGLDISISDCSFYVIHQTIKKNTGNGKVSSFLYDRQTTIESVEHGVPLKCKTQPCIFHKGGHTVNITPSFSIQRSSASDS